MGPTATLARRFWEAILPWSGGPSRTLGGSLIPAAVVVARIVSVAGALRNHLDRPTIVSLAELSGPLWKAVAGCRFEGRPLAPLDTARMHASAT